MIHTSRFMLRSVVAVAFCGIVPSAFAALVVNPAMDITQTVRVQPILVGNDDGSDRGEFFGTPGQQSIIEGFIDDIWAQAGIDVNFLPSTNWNSTSANNGPGVFTIVDDADFAGVNNADPNVINMYFIDRVSGSTPSENSAEGLAVINGNGVRQFVGSRLLNFTGGQEVIAGVVAHEIGHNLGLRHVTIEGNLMQASFEDERLNDSQIATALGSNFSVPNAVTPPPPPPPAVPVPAAAWLFGSALVGLVGVRRSRSA